MFEEVKKMMHKEPQVSMRKISQRIENFNKETEIIYEAK